MEEYGLVIIGGGPAGLAAAVEACRCGLERIVILERDYELGGILNQCIHNGFGLHTFKEELTGPEYAERFIRQVHELGIEYRLNTLVVELSAEGTAHHIVTAVNCTDGVFQIRAAAVILAMGCRERARGALNIPGFRPAGVYSAGTAQRLVNVEGYLPGKEVVILGSGDIGLIMARRMTLEGAKVKAVVELMPYSGGLKRNIVQCLEDYGIPLKLSHTVIDIRGKKRVEGVTIARVGQDRKPIPGTEEEYACDTLLLSCGLIPENELSAQMGVEMNRVTGGPVVDESLETGVAGVFACGNVLHVHDLVDFVSQEAAYAGQCAARYVRERGKIPVAHPAGAVEGSAGHAAGAAEVSAGHPASAAEGSAGHPAGAVEVSAGHPASVAEISEGYPAGNTETCPVREERSAQPVAFSQANNRDGQSAASARVLRICPEAGVRYTVPTFLHPDRMPEELTVRFRVSAEYRGCRIAADLDGKPLVVKKRPVMAPGEMEHIILKREMLEDCPGEGRITVRIEEAG